MDGLTPNGRAVFASTVSLYFLACVAVALRLVAKSLVKTGFAADDFWIVLALVSSLVSKGFVIWGLMAGGGGADLGVLSRNPSQLSTYLKSTYIAYAFFFVTVTAVKISILCFYRRIFSTPPFRRISLLVGVVVILWYIAGEISFILLCLPIERYWIPSLPGHCLDYNSYFLVVGIVETAIDVVILILPVRMISTLQLSSRDKMSLLVIFLLGGFVIITGIVRIPYTYRPDSPYFSFTKAELWSIIHTSTAIICACLPICRPLLTRIMGIFNNLIQRYGPLLGPHASNPSCNQSGLLEMNYSHGDKIGRIEVIADPTGRRFVGPEGYSEANIAVTKTVTIV